MRRTSRTAPRSTTRCGRSATSACCTSPTTHAQLLPVHFREPSVNLGVGAAEGQPPHLVGEHLLKRFDIAPRTREAHAFTYLDFEAAAKAFGTMGGFAHLATLVRLLKATRPGALLLDGGDTWQGSATSLWTRGQDMIDAQKRLGVDVMTGHWEFTYGAERVKEVVEKDFAGKIEFLAQNVRTADFDDPVFKPYVIREINGVPVAIIGQAFPVHADRQSALLRLRMDVRHPGRRDAEGRRRGARERRAVSWSCFRTTGWTSISSSRRASPASTRSSAGTRTTRVPQPTVVGNRNGKTLVTNAGSNGKFVAVLDLDVRRQSHCRFSLSPACRCSATCLPPDPGMAAHVARVRAPFAAKLDEKLATTEALLYRRGNFNGTLDQLICDALMAEKNAPIAFSPGFRWGTSLLPGEAITMDHVMNADRRSRIRIRP